MMGDEETGQAYSLQLTDAGLKAIAGDERGSQSIPSTAVPQNTNEDLSNAKTAANMAAARSVTAAPTATAPRQGTKKRAQAQRAVAKLLEAGHLKEIRARMRSAGLHRVGDPQPQRSRRQPGDPAARTNSPFAKGPARGRSAATLTSNANEGARRFHQSIARRSPLARRTPGRSHPDHRVARHPRGQSSATPAARRARLAEERGAERTMKRLPSCSISVSVNESRSAMISGQEHQVLALAPSRKDWHSVRKRA